VSNYDNSELGQNFRFRMRVDDLNLLWNKVEGLTAQYDIFEWQEGGNNGFVHRLPGRVKYQNIKLTRSVDGYSKDIAKWFTKQDNRNRRTTGVITALTMNGESGASWSLRGVFPVKYTGPSLDIGGHALGTEVLELAHSGFEFESGGG